MKKHNGKYILMLSKWYPFDKDPQMGVFIQKQAEAIAAYHTIVVWSAHVHNNDFRKDYELESTYLSGVYEYRMYYRRLNSVFAKPLNAIRYFIAWHKSKKVIIEHHGKPSLMHAYILLRPAVIACLYGMIWKIPVVISEQWSGYTNGNFERRNFLARFLSKMVFRSAKVRICVSEFLKSSMIKLGFHNQIKVIPNIIKTENPVDKIPNGKINLLVVADLTDEIKNISGVLNAFAEVRKEIPALYLSIIGHGKDEMKLKHLSVSLGLTSDSMQFEGLKDNSTVYKALWQCDFLIMNSRFETFSLICAEALSCGKPVIATRCGGPEDFINEANGYLIPVDDNVTLAHAIRKMSAEYKNFNSEKLREMVINKYSKEQVGRMLSTVYAKYI